MIRADVINCMGVSPVYFLKLRMNQLVLIPFEYANAGDPTGAHGFSTTTSTSYYVTFQVESGDRMELRVSRSEYGLLAERNQGNLSFQGTRYLGFEITS